MDKISDNIAASSLPSLKPTTAAKQLSNELQLATIKTELSSSYDVLHTEKSEPVKKSAKESCSELREIQQEQIDALAKRINRELKFEYDEEHGEQIVYIYDKTSGDLIRQIPSQELMELNSNLAQYPVNSINKKV
ncbi:flagellar protein FlaG [Photobacterium sp. ZSDE20]|uniref:Flagellar protein FlaG n=1 Tax=Photobacterium pectinilyticum TaxID=2906793 RepID=A0ABT1N0N2_9GAMM|nr:flagellar protein FlaG [Photobacterium sp. ZSDE20]MCQ1058295.1 flagellar protein FlaG [Photobacterium sp. ZSDE20]MDD1823090.1 flagellar protein FlaG [Photobacterium sp. ZSDE20]